MALAPSDETDLLLPLHGGVFERPLWATFLRRLLARTGADRLALQLAGGAGEPAHMLLAASDPAAPRPNLAVLADCGALPLGSLRAGRVYALAETRSLEQGDVRERQERELARQEIAHARFIRVSAPRGRDCWLLAFHRRRDFEAADSALLSSLAPHLATAIAALAHYEQQDIRLAMAEDALSRLGIEQAALDHDGAIVQASPGWRGRQIAPAGGGVLLRPLPQIGTALPVPARTIAAARKPRREDRRRGAEWLARSLGLSAKEAALAEALSRGESIVEAGRALGLTSETARNYSKRIYAKTGANGQADLVRIVLTGLTPLA